MAEKMRQYIAEQPRIWQDAIPALTDALCRAARKMRRGRETALRVVMIGTGSSFYAARAACRFLLKDSGEISFFAVAPEDMGPFGKPDGSTVYWCVSQSGKSTSTGKAACLLAAQGAYVVSFTADSGFPITRQAADYIQIPCGPETVGPKTKGMSATLLTLWLAGQALICGCDEALLTRRTALLTPAFQAAGENLARSSAFARKHCALLAEAPFITVVAEGGAFPLAQEGALKLLETLYAPAFAWEFEEYLHGVHNSMEKGAVFIFVLREGPDCERMKRLISFCSAQSCACLVIDCTGTGESGGFTLPLLCPGPEEALGFSLLLPFQILSAVVSEYKGIDCDLPRFPEFYAALDTKLQEQAIGARARDHAPAAEQLTASDKEPIP